jgi:D-proline reductase (dithiol) PrdB
MSSFAELSAKDRAFMERYTYRRSVWREMAALRKPLHEARGALVTTAALHLPDQPPFDPKVRGGDWSYREIPGTVEVQRLRTSHRSRSFDRSGIARDPNLAFPLDRLRELSAGGKLAPPMDRHFSFMGSITAPGRLIQESAPEVALKLKQDGADWVLLTPV